MDNLCAVVDRNHLQISGTTEQVMTPGDLHARFAAFGWHVVKIDGHDMDAILGALKRARAWKEGPYAIIARTVKGKGVSYMENNVAYHSAGLQGEDYTRALQDLEKEEKSL